MEEAALLRNVQVYVKGVVAGYDSGHGWSHIERVVRLAAYIHESEKKGDMLTVLLGALMHDVGDHKFAGLDGPAEIIKVLGKMGVSEVTVREVVFINRNISFSKRVETGEGGVEFRIVQDADRLDAIGAVGIARAFNYGGFKGREIYDPRAGYINPVNFRTPLPSSESTIHHFYEKLLLIKELMNTDTGRRLAEERHQFMITYLEQFYRELGTGDR